MPLDQDENTSNQLPLSSNDEVLIVGPEAKGERLDRFLGRQYPEMSRSALSRLITQNLVLVDGGPVKAGYSLRQGNRICISFPQPESSELLPKPVDFPILYEDEEILVINKPPGLVVHPGCATREQATLVHGLLFYCQQLPVATSGRPGIVHRLDKDTSGAMVIAKTERALRSLTADFKNRKVRKAYQALLARCPKEVEGKIIAPVGRHPVHRQKMAIIAHGRYAASFWQITERFANGWALAQIRIETGRTHQIRVHMASIHCPVVGDTVYGGATGQNAWLMPQRQMLHARQLDFPHPGTGAIMRIQAPLWPDMMDILNLLRNKEQLCNAPTSFAQR